jgi:hypothetical protein
LEQQKQNGGQNQDGRQSEIFHSSDNFYANQLKLGIWKESLKNKSVEEFFFKTSKWWIKSRWRQQPLFFFFSLSHIHFSNDFKI